MSLKVSAAAVRAYDTLRSRPGARDPAGVAAIESRLRELIQTGRVGGHDGQGGALFVLTLRRARTHHPDSVSEPAGSH